MSMNMNDYSLFRSITLSRASITCFRLYPEIFNKSTEDKNMNIVVIQRIVLGIVFGFSINKRRLSNLIIARESKVKKVLIKKMVHCLSQESDKIIILLCKGSLFIIGSNFLLRSISYIFRLLLLSFERLSKWLSIITASFLVISVTTDVIRTIENHQAGLVMSDLISSIDRAP